MPSECVDPFNWYNPQPAIIRLIFDWHKKEANPLHELLAQKGDDTHVEENASQHGNRHNFDQWGQENGTSNENVGENGGQTLFPFL